MALATDEDSLPLLPGEVEYTKRRHNIARFLRLVTLWILKITMWAIFICWVSWFYIIPSEFGTDLYDSWVDATSGTLFGETGSALLLYSGPILIIAFLAVPYLLLLPNEDNDQLQEKEVNKCPRFGFRTFPVLVDGPFGVVSAAELIGIILFLLFVLWAMYIATVANLKRLPSVPSYATLTPGEKRTFMLQMTADAFGFMAACVMVFLFIPVARGSILLRLINIPFEHAVKYHIWLGNLTMFLVTLHATGIVIVWVIRGILLKSIVEWKSDTGANLAGVICYSFGLAMWATSLPAVRKKCFELFYYTHHLYILFIIFYALHVGGTSFSQVVGGIFLFMLDRFLRFWQSRRPISISSTSIFSCGFVKLVFLKPKNLHYNALSFVFLRVREISFQQWHPFSVSSSQLDDKYHLSVLIKAVGDWTSKLRKRIGTMTTEESPTELSFQPHLDITAFVEGPYGHESSYHLLYENLVLVAGGSGISPFLALMSDILHRIRRGRSCLLKNIILIWAVKKSNELSVLHTIDKYPFSDRLCIESRLYVTQETEAPLFECQHQEKDNFDMVVSSSPFPVSKGQSISALVGTESKIWFGVYIISSTLGFTIILGLLDVFYINPLGITVLWYKGILLVGCMVSSVILFGGFVIYLWHLWVERHGNTWETVNSEEDLETVDMIHQNKLLNVEYKDLIQEKLGSSSKIEYGCRPDFKEIFGSISKRWGHVNIGVIVCGPSTLESSIAKECRSQNLSRSCNSPIFHFNSHSFHF